MKPVSISDEMLKCLKYICEHRVMVRYNGGFWSRENSVKVKINDSVYFGDVPDVYFDVRTLRSLDSKGLIRLREKNEYLNDRAEVVIVPVTKNIGVKCFYNYAITAVIEMEFDDRYLISYFPNYEKVY